MSNRATSLALGGLIFAAAACTPPPAPPAEDAAPAEVTLEDVVEDVVEEVAEEEAGESPVFSDGTIRAAMNGADAQEFPASECLIVNDGANGVARGGEGSFELGWADGTYRLVWDSGHGVYIDTVTGTLDGKTVTFEGASNGNTVSGTVTCD
ncbi:MAG: hypothetical protein KDA53_10285 [Hyphomonas sp.]|nr:hypothetical protein [Hyphomonas sp.]